MGPTSSLPRFSVPCPCCVALHYRIMPEPGRLRNVAYHSRSSQTLTHARRRAKRTVAFKQVDKNPKFVMLKHNLHP